MLPVVIKMVPDKQGRPTDIVRIHYFVWDEKGPIALPQKVTPTALGPLTIGGNVVTGAFRGRLACAPGRAENQPVWANGRIVPCPQTDDPRAATCPECMASEDYKKAMAGLSELLNIQAAV